MELPDRRGAGTLDELDSRAAPTPTAPFLDSSDDYKGSYASRLSWRATSSGEKYVFVEGYGIRDLAPVTVSLIDDHGNDYESATPVAIGESRCGRARKR